MSPEIDKGSILLQEKVIIDEDLTFKQTYENLSKSIECLFEKHKQELIHSQLPSFKQLGKGSYHRLVDLQPVSSIMKYGWETVIKNAKRDYLYLLQSQGHKDLCCIHHGN